MMGSLHGLAESGQVEFLKKLLDTRADVNQLDHDENTPLHFAAANGRDAACELLLQKGANVRHVNNDVLHLPLHEAAKNGHARCVQLICFYGLSKGLDINSQTNDGSTALHLALAGGHVDAAILMVEANVNIDACDGNGQTALHFAAALGDEYLLRLIIASGADVNAYDNSGFSPLLMAAYVGSEIGIKVLLAYGADPDLQDDTGCTPLHKAASLGFVNCVRLLCEARANVDLTDTRGRKPSDESTAEPIIAILTEYRNKVWPSASDEIVANRRAFTSRRRSQIDRRNSNVLKHTSTLEPNVANRAQSPAETSVPAASTEMKPLIQEAKVETTVVTPNPAGVDETSVAAAVGDDTHPPEVAVPTPVVLSSTIEQSMNPPTTTEAAVIIEPTPAVGDSNTEPALVPTNATSDTSEPIAQDAMSGLITTCNVAASVERDIPTAATGTTAPPHPESTVASADSAAPVPDSVGKETKAPNDDDRPITSATRDALMDNKDGQPSQPTDSASRVSPQPKEADKAVAGPAAEDMTLNEATLRAASTASAQTRSDVSATMVAADERSLKDTATKLDSVVATAQEEAAAAEKAVAQLKDKAAAAAQLREEKGAAKERERIAKEKTKEDATHAVATEASRKDDKENPQADTNTMSKQEVTAAQEAHAEEQAKATAAAAAQAAALARVQEESQIAAVSREEQVNQRLHEAELAHAQQQEAKAKAKLAKAHESQERASALAKQVAQATSDAASAEAKAAAVEGTVADGRDLRAEKGAAQVLLEELQKRGVAKSSRGQPCGVGLQMRSARGDAVVVDKLVPGGSAARLETWAKANMVEELALHADDVIVAIDGKLIAYRGAAYARQLIIGEEGTLVTFVVSSARSTQQRTVTLIRATNAFWNDYEAHVSVRSDLLLATNTIDDLQTALVTGSRGKAVELEAKLDGMMKQVIAASNLEQAALRASSEKDAKIEAMDVEIKTLDARMKDLQQLNMRDQHEIKLVQRTISMLREQEAELRAEVTAKDDVAKRVEEQWRLKEQMWQSDNNDLRSRLATVLEEVAAQIQLMDGIDGIVLAMQEPRQNASRSQIVSERLARQLQLAGSHIDNLKSELADASNETMVLRSQSRVLAAKGAEVAAVAIIQAELDESKERLREAELLSKGADMEVKKAKQAQEAAEATAEERSVESASLLAQLEQARADADEMRSLSEIRAVGERERMLLKQTNALRRQLAIAESQVAAAERQQAAYVTRTVAQGNVSSASMQAAVVESNDAVEKLKVTLAEKLRFESEVIGLRAAETVQAEELSRLRQEIARLKADRAGWVAEHGDVMAEHKVQIALDETKGALAAMEADLNAERQTVAELRAAAASSETNQVALLKEEMTRQASRYEAQLSILKGRMREQEMLLQQGNTARSQLTKVEAKFDLGITERDVKIHALESQLRQTRSELTKLNDASEDKIVATCSGLNKDLLESMRSGVQSEVLAGRQRVDFRHREDELIDQVTYWRKKANATTEAIAASEQLLEDSKAEIARLRALQTGRTRAGTASSMAEF